MLHGLQPCREDNPLFAMAGSFQSPSITTTSENVRFGLEHYLKELGFTDVSELHREMTLFGSLSHYRAMKTSSA